MKTNITNNELFNVLKLMKKRAPMYLISLVLHDFIQALFLNIMLAFIMKDAVNAVMDGNWKLIQNSIFLAVVSLLIGIIFTPTLSYISTYCTKKTMADLKLKAYSHLENLSITSFDAYHTGDVLSRMTTDITTIEEIYSTHIPRLSFAIIYGILAMVTIFSLEYRIGILVLFIGFISIVINIFFSKSLKKAANAIQKNKGLLIQTLIDILEGFQTIKMFHLEKVLFERYRTQNEILIDEKNKQTKTTSLLMMTNTIYENLRYIGLLIIGLVLSIHSSLDIGSIAAIVHLQGNASYFFDNIGSFITGIRSSLAGSTRLNEFFGRQKEEETNKEIQMKCLDNPIIDISDVNFHYLDNKIVLNHINIKINQGEVCSLVGPSGSGKSSIFKLLLRFYKQIEGNISIYGNNISEYSLKQLRDMFSYVPQDAYLFTGTIEENIRYGNLNASIEEIEYAAKLAYANDFILSLTDGYQTMVGEKGAKLSGGEKQRISIARAFLKNAPILLLDEATSALDSESVEMVQKALDILAEGKTTIVISHRLITTKEADVIYVLNEGIIEETGTHETLLNNRGLYNKLYRLQFEQEN